VYTPSRMAAIAGPRPVLRFGPFEFDPATGELFRDGLRVPLQEKPCQVLAALLEQPGAVATREELRRRLWETDTFVDFEHGLNTAIKKVRKALGDSADAPQFIETLARRGYRFVAPVTPAPVGNVVPARDRAIASPPAPTVRVRRALAVLVAVAAMAGVWLAQNFSSAAPPLVDSTRPSTQLAVLPLRVIGGTAGEDHSYMGTAIADAITTRLANVRQIGLRPTAAVLRFSAGDGDPTAIARTLAVDYLLVGTIQPAERTFRFAVQLVRADGVAVWGRTYDEPRAAVLAIQDHIAEQIVSALRVELSPPERARLHVRYTENPRAYDLYLRGRALLVTYTEAKMRDAIGYFEQALALDEQYALARASLATAAAWFSVRYAYEAEARSWGERADREARRALAQDPMLADAQLAIASAAGTLFGGFNWAAVLDGTAKALALDPSLDLAHVVRMRAFYYLGEFDSARTEARIARALNPSPNVELARLEVATELFAGAYDTAERTASGLLRETDAPAVRHYLGLAKYYRGDVAGGREVLASVMRGGTPDIRSQASLASIEAATGLRDQARARIATIERGTYMDHHVAYSLGAAHAQLGDAAQAMKWLRQAVDTGLPCMPWFARDPLLAPVRERPEFARLLRR
jgi:DNA-binding winged helix-turn-helix (wHTH) protein/TolB-like protein